MKSIVILGASGFLGRTMIANVPLNINVKAVARTPPSGIKLNQRNIKWYTADLCEKKSIRNVLSPGDIVVNLAYIPNADEAENFALVDNVIEACIHSKVSRLVHCSTAVVVGDSKIIHVDELSLCSPVTSYEQVKLALEQRVLNALPRGLDVAILRPTAIVGSGGKNLLKLANSLLYGNQFINYLKVCVLGVMPMHLVPVRNVVAALFHLATFPKSLGGNIFIVSSDEDINNNYQKIETILMDALGLSARKFPIITLPRAIQFILFKLLGRNDINMYRTYYSKKLSEAGFIHMDSVTDAIRQFAESTKLDGDVKTNTKKVIS